VTVVLVGHLVDTDLSDTLSRVQECGRASVSDVSLSAPEGTDEVSSARIRLVARTDGVEPALETVREVAREKDVRVIEPLAQGGDR